MAEVVVVAVLTVRPGKEELAQQLASSLVEPTHQEKGCLLYSLNRSADGSILSFVERWESPELLATHLANTHVVTFGERAEEAFSSVDVYELEALPLGSPAKGTIAGRAGSTAEKPLGLG